MDENYLHQRLRTEKEDMGELPVGSICGGT